MKDIFGGKELEIFEYLRESQHRVLTAIGKFRLDCSIEDIVELMEMHNYAQCPFCSWWVEKFELIPEDSDDDEPDGHCGNCRDQINE